MKKVKHAEAGTTTPNTLQRMLETLLFLAASGVGVYGIGRGLAGFYEPGQPISLIWLAVTGVAVFVLFAQMGRIHDTWVHKPAKSAMATITASEEADESPDRGGK